MSKPKLNDIERVFPAKFTASILDALEDELRTRLPNSGMDDVILDIFGGVGGVHKLADRFMGLTTVAVELEREFADNHERTVCGDSSNLGRSELLQQAVAAITGGRRPNAIVTSPAYGNRLADQYLGSDDEKCRRCMGNGQAITSEPDGPPCPQCDGSGKAKSTRKGYAIAKGERLSDGSGAALFFGDAYKALHHRIISGVAEYVEPGTLWLVNVSSFIADKKYVPAMEWWVGEMALHTEIIGLRAVPTPRSREGANHEARVDAEHIIIARTI